jgi:uncharacterized protein with HEPN domain
VTKSHPERDPDHLRHALRCADRIARLMAIERGALLANDDLIDALCWNLYQLADVTGKISDPVKVRHPEVPWRAIAGLRNFYAHAYEGIDVERMWGDLRRGDVADLAAQLDVIYRELAPPADDSVTRR